MNGKKRQAKVFAMQNKTKQQLKTDNVSNTDIIGRDRLIRTHLIQTCT